MAGHGVRRALGVLLSLVLLAVIAVLALSVSLRPEVMDAAPDPADAALARDVALRLQDIATDAAADGTFTASEAEVNAVLAAAGRLVPGTAGTARIHPDRVELRLTARPLARAQLWLNAQVTVAASEDGLEIEEARLGRLPLPSSLVLPAVARVLDAYLGDGLGEYALEGIGAVRTEPPDVTVVLEFGGDAQLSLFERLRDRLRESAAGPTNTDRVWTHLWYLGHEGDARDLPRGGSALPYLQQVLTKPDEIIDAPPEDEMKAAIFALALYCGDPQFGVAIGVSLNAHRRGAGNHCARTTLGGRRDLRQHFVLSAGIQAATGGSTVLGVGELKELLDSTAGGSGFSFDDMAANLAGARFAAALMAAPREDWAAMAARLTEEADIFPSLEGLPRGLSETEFRARYGAVDSPEYAAVLEEITRRIDALPFYAAAPEG
mgnify:CR=1 FL=1